MGQLGKGLSVHLVCLNGKGGSSRDLELAVEVGEPPQAVLTDCGMATETQPSEHAAGCRAFLALLETL